MSHFGIGQTHSETKTPDLPGDISGPLACSYSLLEYFSLLAPTWKPPSTGVELTLFTSRCDPSLFRQGAALRDANHTIQNGGFVPFGKGVHTTEGELMFCGCLLRTPLTKIGFYTAVGLVN